jgi:hypothetical protein
MRSNHGKARIILGIGISLFLAGCAGVTPMTKSTLATISTMTVIRTEPDVRVYSNIVTPLGAKGYNTQTLLTSVTLKDINASLLVTKKTMEEIKRQIPSWPEMKIREPAEKITWSGVPPSDSANYSLVIYFREIMFEDAGVLFASSDLNMKVHGAVFLLAPGGKTMGGDGFWYDLKQIHKRAIKRTDFESREGSGVLRREIEIAADWIAKNIAAKLSKQIQ